MPSPKQRDAIGMMLDAQEALVVNNDFVIEEEEVEQGMTNVQSTNINFDMHSLQQSRPNPQVQLTVELEMSTIPGRSLYLGYDQPLKAKVYYRNVKPSISRVY